MKPFIAAIIDDGITCNKRIPELLYNIEINEQGVINKGYGDTSLPGFSPGFSFSHGTLCAEIIKTQAPDVKLASIKILDEKGKCPVESLYHGLAWAVDNEFPLINMSLGTINIHNSTILEELITRAYRKGIVIVAACHNSDIRSFPASFQQVIGVKVSKTHDHSHGFFFHHDPMDGIDVEVTSKTMEQVLSHAMSTKGTSFHAEKNNYFSNSNSYAAPYITGLIAHLFRDLPLSICHVKKILYKKAVKRSTTHRHIFPVEWLKGNFLFIGHHQNDFLWPVLNNPIHKEYGKKDDINLDYKMNYIHNSYNLIDIGSTGFLNDTHIKDRISDIKTLLPGINGVILTKENRELVSTIINILVPGGIDFISTFPLHSLQYNQKALFHNIWFPHVLYTENNPPDKKTKKRPEEFPILIYISSREFHKRIVLAKSISSHFSKNGYGLFLASHNIFAPLFGFHTIRSVDCLKRCADIYKADVILFEGSMEGIKNGSSDTRNTIIRDYIDLYLVEMKQDYWKIIIPSENNNDNTSTLLKTHFKDSHCTLTPKKTRRLKTKHQSFVIKTNKDVAGLYQIICSVFS